MEKETTRNWWETVYPGIEKEVATRQLKYYEEREKNLVRYNLAKEEWSKKQDALSIGERLDKSFSKGFVFDTLEDYKPKKTRDDVERLKRKWLKEGVWDLWETEGFEEYFFELRSFQFEELYKYKSDLYEEQINYTEELLTKIKELENLLTKKQTNDCPKCSTNCLFSGGGSDVLQLG